MTRTVFEFGDYKHYLSERGNSRGERTQMAVAIRCGASFISKVLHGKTHFTPDHAVALARHWKMTREETEYFLELVQLGRAGTKLLQDVIHHRLEEIRERTLARRPSAVSSPVDTGTETHR